jgi:hypothetical protein
MEAAASGVSFQEKIKLSPKSIHVVPANGKWAVQVGEEENAVSEHRIQVTAIMFGRQLARLRHAELLIHGRDGCIRAKGSYVAIPSAWPE